MGNLNVKRKSRGAWQETLERSNEEVLGKLFTVEEERKKWWWGRLLGDRNAQDKVHKLPFE